MIDLVARSIKKWKEVTETHRDRAIAAQYRVITDLTVEVNMAEAELDRAITRLDEAIMDLRDLQRENDDGS